LDYAEVTDPQPAEPETEAEFLGRPHQIAAEGHTAADAEPRACFCEPVHAIHFGGRAVPGKAGHGGETVRRS
jgi:hypothetical protein